MFRLCDRRSSRCSAAGLGFILIAASLAGMGALLAAPSTPSRSPSGSAPPPRLSRHSGVALAGSRHHPRDTDRSAAAGEQAAHVQPGLPGGGVEPEGRDLLRGLPAAVHRPGDSFVVQLLIFGGTFVVVEVSYELLLAGMAQRIAPGLPARDAGSIATTGGTFIGVGALLTTAEPLMGNRADWAQPAAMPTPAARSGSQAGAETNSPAWCHHSFRHGRGRPSRRRQVS